MHADFEMANGNTTTQANETLLRVLLVDDELTMHEIIGLALNRSEYSLISATSVDEAMKQIASADPPDIVITDALMPGDSGFTLITAMKSNPVTSGIPIILWTVLEQGNGSVMDSSGKADITMSKPFNLPNLLESLAKGRQLIKPDEPCVEILF
jgi:DNA-binding response OmpR family regulator